MNKKKKPIKRGQNYIKEPPINKERLHWKVFFIGYLICCVISVCVTGVPKWTYLIPIKVDAVLGAIFFGTFSETSLMPGKNGKKSNYDFSEARWRSGLYVIIATGLLLIMGIIINSLLYVGVITDIAPFMGMFEKLN
jgi:hypothetical protein